jgi:hypothetical protein
MMRALARTLVALLASWLGCTGPGTGPERGAGRAGRDEVGGSVVSTVNGHAIRVAEVEATAHATGIPRRESLRRLQSERLLVEEATRRGRFARAPEVVDVARRAAVQALLDVEAAEVTVPDGDVEEAYEEQRARFETKEQRVVVHFLAGMREGAPEVLEERARAFAAAALEELKVVTDLPAWKAKHTGKVIEGVQTLAENLPPLAREGRVVKPFEDAMFSLAQPGVVPAPVRTSYGWHAIRVLEITPAKVVPYETAAATLRNELRLERQTAHVAKLIEQLRRQHPVVVTPEASARLAELEI